MPTLIPQVHPATNEELDSEEGAINFQISQENPEWQLEKEKCRQEKLRKGKQKCISAGLRRHTRSSKAILET